MLADNNYLLILISIKATKDNTNQQTKWFTPKFSEATDFIALLTQKNVNFQQVL